MVTVDGQPIAQVAVDDIDVSKMCKHFATIQKSVLSALDQENLGEYEDTVITSSGRHLLMRMIGPEKKIFLVVMTTRSSKPDECLEMMVNVGGAVSAALR